MSTELPKDWPAYPCPSVSQNQTTGETVVHQTYGGMSLRDYFAAKAMRKQPLFPSNLWQAIRWAFGFQYEASCFEDEHEAICAYRQADAMLKAREA